MFCNLCGKIIPRGGRIWECTVGEAEEDLEGEGFFEPSEHTDHRCPECMGEKIEMDCEECGQPIYEGEPHVVSEGLWVHAVCPPLKKN